MLRQPWPQLSCSVSRVAGRGKNRVSAFPLLALRLSPPSPLSSAFTLVEVLVVLTIIAILAALLLPALSSAKAKGKQIGCANNLKQLALGFQMYAADNDGRLPQNTPLSQGNDSWVAG